MQIGVGLTYWPWTALAEQVQLARLADKLGFSSVWVSETWGQDGVGMLGYVAAVTKRIALGAAVIQMPARQATAVGMATATTNELSRGRVLLGLGLSGPQVSERRYGVPFTTPLRRTREYNERSRATRSSALSIGCCATARLRPTTGSIFPSTRGNDTASVQRSLQWSAESAVISKSSLNALTQRLLEAVIEKPMRRWAPTPRKPRRSWPRPRGSRCESSPSRTASGSSR
jgi:alkanesulfonate monooxygenase SsuD/methylene tetrahydromethanopterin reductase-like flavin-dependent oxidoreductase (luciferase family)